MFNSYGRYHWYLIPLAIVVLSQLPLASTSSSKTSEMESSVYTNSTLILEALLKGYDRRIRPDVKGTPQKVRVDMYVANIWAMEEVKMEFTIDIYLRQYWRDERLSFAHLTSDPILTLSSNINKQIWIPSTYFLNTKRAYMHDVTTENYLLQIRPNGSIFYSIRLTITTSCMLNLRKFPHDTQRCTLALESYGYQTSDVWYAWNDRNDNTSAIFVNKAVELPQFELVGVDKTSVINQYNIGNHSSLIATFKMRRRIGYFLIDTYVPSTIIVIISWISFWISPESAPARVALGITTVLTMTTLISSARASLPKVSYVKAIDWYLLLCLIFVFGSIMEYTFVAFILNIMKTKKKKREAALEERDWSTCSKASYNHDRIESGECPSLFAPKCSPKRGNRLTRLCHKKEKDELPEVDLKTLGDKMEERHWFPIQDPITVDRISRIGFPLTFFAFNCIYWLIHKTE
ncbi:Gamma-aminobutyric acid receptor subunit beta-1 [Acropora cervicornis]|uniref:Gamma-aminobutyric acid receptor subunit beta-1 n=1 Tax=Acropora cervicornis TaxID=6130 RepID=A0AAD9UST6_ACRCE|nr:Gamma-aminobutyric acid receptor subunit beta-1 [Acropora cervicornis]